MSDPKTGTLRAHIRVLWTFARPHSGAILLGLALGLITTGAALATPLATKWVMDSLGGNLDLSKPIGLLLILLVVGSAAAFAQWYVLGRTAERIVLNARVSLVERFFRAKLQQIHRFRTGELVTRVTSDTVLLREAATTSVVQIINGIVSVVGTVILMAVLDVPLVLATLAAVLLVGAILGGIMPLIGKADRQAQEALGDLGGSLEGGIRAIRTVKSSRAEDRVIDDVNAQAHIAAKHSLRSVLISSTAWTIAAVGIQLVIIAILGIGAWRIGEGALAVSTLVAFLLYAYNLIDPISDMTMAFTQLQSGLAAAARIHETEDLALEDVTARAGGSHLKPLSTDAVLELENITARYDDATTPALNGVSLSIPRTGHTAFVGPSGAGKTSIFSLLLRFLEPESGTVKLDGVSYQDWNIDEVRRRIAYVEQETPVVPGTVRENVNFRDPAASEEEIWAALEAVHLADTVRALPEGLETSVAATNLSGGERQRLAVARALIRAPEVLLLDEATAQLDGITEAAIQTAIAEAAARGAVVTIAHRLSTVVDADTIFIIDDGQVRDSGTHAALYQRDELYREFIAALRISV